MLYQIMIVFPKLWVCGKNIHLKENIRISSLFNTLTWGYHGPVSTEAAKLYTIVRPEADHELVSSRPEVVGYAYRATQSKRKIH